MEELTDRELWRAIRAKQKAIQDQGANILLAEANIVLAEAVLFMQKEIMDDLLDQINELTFEQKTRELLQR